MVNSALILALLAAGTTGAPISSEVVKQQNDVFSRLWYEDFVWRFEDLPTQGSVPPEQVPYSGYIYLDKKGGTVDAMRKYDRACNSDRSYPATSWEYSDTSAARSSRSSGGFGLFRGRTSSNVNHWYGHCNGWTAAAIRHAEPQRSVVYQGVEFTPADIKGLLAEIYMYNQAELLTEVNAHVNAGTLHAILANWLGRGSHPVAMDGDTSREKWNYPIYSFNSTVQRRGPREVEVRTNILYAKDTEDYEHDESPRLHKQRSFHYMLTLNAAGDIVGGYYFRGSGRVDFLWVPLSPQQAGEEGNERGNPHVDVERVLAIWRMSVPREMRRTWLIVDPAQNDRAVEVADPTRVLPRNIRLVPPTTAVGTVTGDAGE